MLSDSEIKALEAWEELSEGDHIFEDGMYGVLNAPKAPPKQAPQPTEAPKKSLGEINITNIAKTAPTTSQEDWAQATDKHEFNRLLSLSSIYNDLQKPSELLFGHGTIPARLMLIAGRPNMEDYKLHTPISGAAGDLLAKMLKAIQLEKNLCYISYLFKSPEKKRLLPRQRAMLKKMMLKEVELIKPPVLVLLGEPALQMVTNGAQTMENNPGLFEIEGYKALVIPHPQQLIMQPELKRMTWERLQLLQSQF